MPIDTPERATFRSLSEARLEDWLVIERAEQKYRRERGTGRGLLNVLTGIAHDDPLGAPINVYAHCLQTATRVFEAGRDDELIVVALFHDMPEAFSDNEHGHVAAELLAPRLSVRRDWLLRHHGAFQSLHFANHPTRDRNERERFAGHPHFEETAEFCARYDQNSFDPGYPMLPLAAFEPIVRRFFASPAA